MERFQDDRTEEQRQRLNWGVKMRDSFLSGWGPGRDAGGSIAIWACEHRHLEAVERWVSSRSDATYVAVLNLKGFTAGRARSNYRGQLVHVYAVEEGHPSLASVAPEPEADPDDDEPDLMGPNDAERAHYQAQAQRHK